MFKEHAPVMKAWLFGSQARGEATEESDVDFYCLLDYDLMPSGWWFGGLSNDLEAAMESQVDILTVPPDQLWECKPQLYLEIVRDGVLLYER